MDGYISILKKEIAPALGCTEPIAVALAVAKAREAIGCAPDEIRLYVSRNIFKNAMGVGIPGTGLQGLEIAAALAAVAGNSAYGLEVLRDAALEDVARAKKLSALVHMELAATDRPLYIRAKVAGGGHVAECVIEDAHTNITKVILDGQDVLPFIPNVSKADGCGRTDKTSVEPSMGESRMTVEGIYTFATTVDVGDLELLRAGMQMNLAVAQEGLLRDYGMQVGRKLGRFCTEQSLDYAIPLTAAAADARMGGCTLPVMSTAGSGNQGLAATLPCIAAAKALCLSDEQLLRALAISQLMTIHIKAHIGKLSALCGCAIAASIGSACGITYMMGGQLRETICAVQNMIANISGLICDGAKASCALKIATGVGAALQCARLAVSGIEASGKDGIVSCDVERSIANLGELGSRGMVFTDQVILEMMMCKTSSVDDMQYTREKNRSVAI